MTATALAPPRAASWTVMIPMPPAAPRTSTDSPGAKWAWRRPKWATAPEVPSVTASAADRPAGRGTSDSAGAIACSA